MQLIRQVGDAYLVAPALNEENPTEQTVNQPRTRAPARRREPCICQRQIRKAEPQGTIGAEPLITRPRHDKNPSNASSSLSSRKNAQIIKLKISQDTRAPARRREPCICLWQIRKAEPQGIIGAEPLGIDSDAKQLASHPGRRRFLRKKPDSIAVELT